MRPTPRARRVATYVSALLLALTIAAPAPAQGTDDFLPGPVTTPELLGYGRRLGLSPEQQRAAESCHDRYKLEFRVLRDGDIAELMTLMQSTMGSSMPSRAGLEEFFTELNALNRKIELLDRRFFDQIQPLLSEAQLQLMPRVRDARVRRRCRGNEMMSAWMGGTAPADLSEIILDLELGPEERQHVDAVLIGYESRLTSHFRKLSEANSRIFLDMLDELTARGIDEAAFADPERMEEVQQTAMQVLTDLTRKGRERAAEILALNRRTYDRIGPMLGDGRRRALRDLFLERAYPELAHGFQWDRRAFEHALAVEALTAEQRESVEALLRRVDDDLSRLLEEGMAMIDRFRSEFSPFDESTHEMWQDRTERMNELMVRARTTMVEGQEALLALVGPELAGRLGKAAATDPELLARMQAIAAAGGNVVAAEAMAAAGEAGEVPMPASAPWGGDQYLPFRLGEMELRRSAELAGLDDDQGPVLVSLLEFHEDAYDAIETGAIKSLREVRDGLWQVDPETGQYTPPDPERVEEVYRRRRAALEAIRAADEAFFDHAREMLFLGEEAPVLERMRRIRERATWGRGLHAGYGAPAVGEAIVDLLSLTLEPERRRRRELPAEAETALRAWEQAIAPALRECFERLLDMQQANEAWGLAIQAQQQQPQQDQAGTPVDYAELYRRIMGDRPKRFEEAGAAASEINRAALETLLEVLPEETAHALRDAYRRRAFPQVYADATAVEGPLRKARTLDDLSAEQSRRLGELAGDYLPRYAALCAQMTEQPGGSYHWASLDREEILKMQAREQEIARLRFDRSELNARAISRLRQLLSEEQLAKIGPLPDLRSER